MSWPFDARYVTVVDGATLINAAILNAIQDEIIKARSPKRQIVDGHEGKAISGWSGSDDNGPQTTTGVLRVPFRPKLGDRIISFTVAWISAGGAAADLSAQLRKSVNAAPFTLSSTATIDVALTSAATTNGQVQTLTLATPYVVVADEAYWLEVTAAATGLKTFVRAEFVTDRLIA